MSSSGGRRESTVAEKLLDEFNEIMRVEGRPDFTLLERCPLSERKELLSLMNVSVLAYRALAPEREAFQARMAKLVG